MKGNKGFTLVELIVTFTLVATIAIILFQLVSNLRQIYLAGEIKTTLLNKQGVMVRKISDDLQEYTLQSIIPCESGGLTCLSFSYAEKPEPIKLIVDPGNKTITYNDYTYQLDKTSSFGPLSFEKDESGTAFQEVDDSVFKLNISIFSKLIPDEEFGIHIVGTYNRSNTTIVNQITYAQNANLIRVNGVDTNLEIIKSASNSNLLNGVFVKLYHLDNNNYINNLSELLYNTEASKMSALGGLDAFKKKNNSANILNALEQKINESNISNGEKSAQVSRITQAYQNGYYSLLLNYNNEPLNNKNYYWWNQTNNFVKKQSINGFNEYSSSYNQKVDGIVEDTERSLGNGFTYNDTTSSFANIYGTQYNIGIKQGNIVYPNGSASSVDLYVEARNFLCKYSLNKLVYDGNIITDNTNGYNYADGTDFCN